MFEFNLREKLPESMTSTGIGARREAGFSIATLRIFIAYYAITTDYFQIVHNIGLFINHAESPVSQ